MASVWPLYQRGLIGGVLRRWLSFWKVLHRGNLEICQSDHRALGHLPDCSVWPVLMVLNFFHLRILEATVFLGTFNTADIFWYPSPDLCLDTILSRSSTDNSFNLVLVFALSCTVNCGTLYRQLCAFPNHVQSINFTTSRLQSSCRIFSRGGR